MPLAGEAKLNYQRNYMRKRRAGLRPVEKEAESPSCEGYPDALAALRAKRPSGIMEAAWLRAIDDAAKFLTKWGDRAHEFRWTADDIFGPAGLVWQAQGRPIISLSNDGIAVFADFNAFDRETRRIT